MQEDRHQALAPCCWITFSSLYFCAKTRTEFTVVLQGKYMGTSELGKSFNKWSCFNNTCLPEGLWNCPLHWHLNAVLPIIISLLSSSKCFLFFISVVLRQERFIYDPCIRLLTLPSNRALTCLIMMEFSFLIFFLDCNNSLHNSIYKCNSLKGKFPFACILPLP